MKTQHSFEEFEPMCKWRTEEHQYILEVHLEGFGKDQLKVQINRNGVLTIRGSRPIDGSKSTRFQKTVNVPKDCRTEGIHAKLSKGILTITMPKKTQEHGKRSRPNDDDDKGCEEPPRGQPATGSGVATLKRINARRWFTALKNLSVRNGKGGSTARRLGASIGIVVAVTVGGYIAYKIRQSFHS